MIGNTYGNEAVAIEGEGALQSPEEIMVLNQRPPDTPSKAAIEVSNEVVQSGRVSDDITMDLSPNGDGQKMLEDNPMRDA